MISLRWLQEFADLPDDGEEIAEALANLGHEVEGTRRVEAAFSGVVVARVLEVRPHPRADKLRLVRLDTGSGEQEVVCGAWNFEAGAVVPLSTVGSVLAGGLRVGEREIRGVLSRGMVCSEAELGLSEESSGILVLEGGLALGSDFAAALPYPDVLFEVTTTSNRPDAMSVYGLARDLAAHYGVPVRRLSTEVGVTGSPTTGRAVVEDAERCPRFTAREVRGLTIGPSPLWMRLRLRDAGVRPISNVVDVTNYVMLELGQPLHAFDLDLVPEETLVVRRARPKERLATLDGVERRLSTEDLLIASPAGPLGLAGIMGGESSEVRPETSRVFLEAAHFTAGGVLFSGKRHGLRSEAGVRFERGVDPGLPPIASARAARLMADLAGGEVAGGFIDYYPVPIEPWVVPLPRHEPARLLGAELGAERIEDLLARLGFTVSGGDPWQVTVPTFRPDVTRPADLVEEIARLHGYDEFPSRLPKGVGEGLPVWERRRRLVRRALVGAGCFEVLSLSFQGREEIDFLGLPEGDRRRSMVRMRNPLSEEQAFLRTSLIPALLQSLRLNAARGRGDAAVFEMGRVFFPSDGDLPDQPQRVTYALTGRPPGPRWEGEGPERDARDAVGIWEVLAASLQLDYRLEQAAEPGFHPGRTGRVRVGDSVVGVVGEIHPAVAARFGLIGRVALGDFDLDALMGEVPPRTFGTPSPYPPVVFDLAFDLAEEVPAAALLGEVRAAAGPSLERVEVFDLFRGPPLREGRKSLGVRLTFRDTGRTLTDEDLVPVRARITEGVAASLGGRLRGG
ncbi:MAG: phenylalanine--tRNA ligase subunit beta [Actinobacteria bacterium RBG_16_70_17]|nr:MAG: phenylalanine--tRNA ligase subunit beta [Actinobacteria bacterium RBG_16_70_17]